MVEAPIIRLWAPLRRGLGYSGATRASNGKAGVAAKAARGQYVDNSIDHRCLPTPFSRRRHPTLNPLKRLASQTAIYGVSSVLGRFLNYLLVPLYTYSFLPADYGVVVEFYEIGRAHV